LKLSDSTLYGAAAFGGYVGNGTLFKVNTDGSGFTNLYNFTYTSNGVNPHTRLILSGSTLYGTAQNGGSSGKGTVFAINTDGSSFTNLHSFSGGSDGAYPRAALVLSGNTLYGAVSEGGTSGAGTLFSVRTDGAEFTNIYSFSGGEDGANPIMYSGFVLSGNTLYGTTTAGGVWSNGTVFRINIDGTSFTNLHSFSAGDCSPFPSYCTFTNSDGAKPYGGLALSGNTLYGTASGGGSGAGTVFTVTTDGTDFDNLYYFSVGGSGGVPGVAVTNSDGANPVAGLIFSGNTLYGTTRTGGSSSAGVIFAINGDGTGLTNLHSFAAGAKNSGNVFTNSEGGHPRAGVILLGSTLYGTAAEGGTSGKGTVFSLSLPLPLLTIAPSAANVTLTWPTNASSFSLQSAPAVTGTFTNIPDATSPYTNPIIGAQQFFRLISN